MKLSNLKALVSHRELVPFTVLKNDGQLTYQELVRAIGFMIAAEMVLAQD